MATRKLETAADFLAWEDQNGQKLQRRQDQRCHRIQEAVNEYVRQAMRDWNMTKCVAGDDLLARFPYGLMGKPGWTPQEAREALLAIGWFPSRRRKKGAAE